MDAGIDAGDVLAAATGLIGVALGAIITAWVASIGSVRSELREDLRNLNVALSEAMVWLAGEASRRLNGQARSNAELIEWIRLRQEVSTSSQQPGDEVISGAAEAWMQATQELDGSLDDLTTSLRKATGLQLVISYRGNELRRQGWFARIRDRRKQKQRKRPSASPGGE